MPIFDPSPATAHAPSAEMRRIAGPAIDSGTDASARIKQAHSRRSAPGLLAASLLAASLFVAGSPAALASSQRLSAIVGSTGDDLLYGTAQADTIQGLDGNDALYGLGGDDVLDSGDGDDVLTGGTGDDALYSGQGNSFFVFYAGDGHDRVYHSDPVGQFLSTLQFQAGVDPAATTVERSGDDLIVRYGNADSVTLVDYFPGGDDPWPRGIDEFWFAQNEVWDAAQILSRLPPGQGL
ncbi:calcium-binding protein [Lysobacter enzymogenes]|uniref:calcium-binding protein n=1 Tax=Lysobacter enzymogenes TaxID=69 RepID=UPI00099D7A25|nr:calcium-binding protein [Lysobacter enzymogenes]UZW59798.1 calcium-binding protein [Lysobacter enzymogenes]